MDSFTKWVEVHPMNNIKTVSILKCLRKTFCVFSIPYTLVTDNRPSFVSEEFETLVKKNGIKHLNTALYQPSSNGLTERKNCIILFFTFKLKYILPKPQPTYHHQN